jgi:hypothetical protein
VICQIEDTTKDWRRPYDGGKVIRVLEEIVLPSSNTVSAAEEFIRRVNGYENLPERIALTVYGDASGNSKQMIRLLVIELMDSGGTTPEVTCEVIAEEQPERYAALGPDQMLAPCREIHESSDAVESARLQELFGVFNTKYFGGELDFTVRAVYDPGLLNDEAIAGWVDFVNKRIYIGLTHFFDAYPGVLLHQMAHASTETLDDTDEVWSAEMRRLGELGAPV